MAAGNAEPDDGQLPTLETKTLAVDSSVGAEDRQRIQAIEDSLDKRAKVRGRALFFEQMRTSDGEKLPQKNITFVTDGDQQKNGSRFKMEVMRQERSRKDALDDLKMKNIKTILMKLLNKTGLGRYVSRGYLNKIRFEYFQFAVDYPETLIISSTGKASEAVPKCLGRSFNSWCMLTVST